MSAQRLAGCTIPLFSIRSERDWGIGQITDLPACASWVERAGHRLLQILPAYELADGETSPYGARTSFGLDPIYIGIEAVEDLDPAALDAALGVDGRRELARLRALPMVDYVAVRALKRRVLARAFERFYEREWVRNTSRAEALRAFLRREATWCDDLALYVALRGSHDGWGWESWPAGERDRDSRTLGAARERLERAVLEHQYLQWIAHVQWDRARGETRGIGVELMGDVPFIVGGESADVWARATQFRRDRSLGAPPDAFAPDGQDWGLPSYDWDAMEADDLAWHRARTRHAARLYDRFRLDHVVGYFRQWVRPRGPNGAPGLGRFDPEGEEAQRARGERVLTTILAEAAPAKVIAEDLGMIPPFVRDEMRKLGLPGYRVLPWEKDDEHGYRDPKRYPAVSVASWSTHDTAPITSWWDELPAHDRAGLGRVCGFDASAPEPDRVLAQFRVLFGAASQLTLILAPELLGEHRRINTPGTVGAANWTYRLPATMDDLSRDGAISARFDAIRTLVHEAGRGA
jgi:4-alpha-glucanotransferase